MSNVDIGTVEKLCRAFPMLTEANQQYVLGLAEGLKKAQNSGRKEQPERSENGHRKVNFNIFKED
jgi:hypothetical protein